MSGARAAGRPAGRATWRLLAALVASALLSGAAAADAPGSRPAARPEGGRLSGVEWVGNAHLAGGALADSTGWKPGRRLDAAAWTGLAEGVARAYAAIGRLAAGVADVALSGPPESPAARVTVVEGPQHRVGRIEVLGATALAEEEARRLLDAPAGSPWSSARLEAGVAALLTRYDQLGRPFTQVRLRDVIVTGDRVDARVLIVESDSVVVDSVRVEGPHRTRREVVRRALGGLEGEPYRAELAAAGRARLVDLGVFASVGEPRFELTAPGHGELRYDVVETQASSFDAVFGYEGRSGSLTGLARLGLDNIARTARQADLYWQGRGAGRTEFRLRYREPFLLGSRLAAAASFTQELADTLYTRTEYGVEGSLPLGEGGSLALGLDGGRSVATLGPLARSTWQGTHVALARRSSGWASELRTAPVSGFRAALTTAHRFTRDALRPDGERRGSLLTVGLDAEGERALGLRRFLGLGLESRFRTGSEPVLAVYDLFAVGGATTLRGYREQQFRVSRYALLHAEYGWGGRAARVFLFLDQAVFYRSPGDSLSTGPPGTRYRAGYGFGASLPTSLGRVGLDLGWGKGDGPLDAKLHVRFRSVF